MGRRAASMATIDTILQGQQGTSAGGANTTTVASVAVPHAAPPLPLTADQKRGYDVARQSQFDSEKKQNDAILAEQNQKNAVLADQQKLEDEQQAQQNLFQSSAQGTLAAAGGIVKGTGAQIESLPTPGSIVFPLVVLAAFFFLLLPVNGHTRLVWRWLVLTGNADIQEAASDGSGLGSTTTGSDASNAASIPNTPQTVTPMTGATNFTLPFVAPASTMTGVEDI